MFEGIRGKNYEGDVAIDDISFTDGNCGATSTVQPTTGMANVECNIV